MNKDPLQQVENLTKEIHSYMEKRSKTVLERYPLLFSLLATFGLVSVLYGFERLIDEIPFLNQRPSLMLLMGFAILIFTGSLYKHFKNES